MAEGRWIHGSAVDKVTKDLRFTSVSQVELADPLAEGCLRKYWYRYPGGKKEPPTKNQERGTRGHSEVAAYHQNGNRNFGPLVSRGTFMLLPPGPDLLVEWDILKRPGMHYPDPLAEAHSPQLLKDAPVKLAGVPLLGAIDLSHGRCINQGAEDPSQSKDPDGTVEVIDWKFVGDDRFLKTPETLKKTTQMASYAEWVWQVRPETSFVRLSHGYFPERGRARKVTVLVKREDIAPQVEHAAGVVRSIARAVRENDPDQVDANLAACDKYGGCFHRSYCKAPMRKALAAMVGKTAAEDLKVAPPVAQEIIPVSSLLQRANSLRPATPPAHTTGVQPAVQAAPGPSAAEIAAERERLAAEEAEARRKAIRAEEEAKLRAKVPHGFEQAVDAVRSYNRGFPTLTGAAAIAFYAMGGQHADSDIPGSGEISDITLSDPLLMAQLATELAADAAQNNQQPAPSLLPPDAPPNDPRLASEDAVQTTVAAATSAAPPVTLPTPPAPAAKKRGPKPKTEAAPTQEAPAPAVQAQTPVTAAPADAAVHVFVNCATSLPTISLNDWAQQLADQLAKKFGAVDVRCGGEDTPLGYDKWKGSLMAFARDKDAAPLPGGYYSIDTRYSAVMQVVAEAIALRAKETGGSITWGTR